MSELPRTQERISPSVLAAGRKQIDPNDRVQTGERVPYVVINRQETTRLRDNSQRPEVILFPGKDSLGRPLSPPDLCAPYYIMNRILPALNRVFSLIGVDVFTWYRQDMRRSRRHPLDRGLQDIGLAGASGAGGGGSGRFAPRDCSASGSASWTGRGCRTGAV